jgi:DnaJ-domain-containing protein 1
MNSDKLYERMQKIVSELQGLGGDLVDQLSRQALASLAGRITVEDIMGVAQSMGINLSQLYGFPCQQTGFDPYRVLNLSQSASDEEIRKRYLELMNKLHPDRAGEGFEFLATLVNLAYEAIRRQRRMK